VVVGQIVGVARKSHVPQLGKIKMGEIAMDAASLAMSYVRRTIHHLRPINRPQSAAMLRVLRGVVMVGV
jgi:hypothetical protein